MICKARIEDQELWDTFAADHENVELRNRLVERHWPLAWRLAQTIRRRLPRSVDLADLASAGAVGLIRAVERFEPGRGLEFGKFAQYHVAGAIRDELRRMDHLARTHRAQLTAAGESGPALVSLDAVLPDRWEGEVPATLAETLADPYADDPSEGQPIAAFWDRIDDWLDAGDREILELRFRRGLPTRDVAAAIGVSDSSFFQRRAALIERLRARVRAGSLSRADLVDLLEP